MIFLDILINSSDLISPGTSYAIAPIIAAALIAGAGSAISGIASAVSNRNSVRSTNATNRAIASEANAYNERMMDKQNAWNREQWELENVYNHPQKQVERFEQAGLNPLWIMSGGDAGNASQLTSAQAQPAQVPTMQAPQLDLGFVGQMASSILNTLVSNSELGIKRFEADTHRAAQQSDADRNAATADEARAQAAKLRLETRWEEESFDIRLNQASQTLKNLEMEYDKMDADTEAAKAKKAEIEENKKLITERILEVRASIRQKDRELDIMAQNAAVNAGRLKVEQGKLELEGKKFKAECQKWDNDTIMQYIYRFGRSVSHKNNAGMKAGVKGSLAGIGGSFEGSYSGEDASSHLVPADVEDMARSGIKLTSCVDVLLDRAAANPTPENLRQASEAEGYLLEINSYLEGVLSGYNEPSTTDGVINPVDAPVSFGSRAWLQ